MYKVAICYTKQNTNGIAACDAFAKGIELCGDTAVKIFNESQLNKLKLCGVSVQVCDANRHMQNTFRPAITRLTKKLGIRRIIIDSGFMKNNRFDDDNITQRYMAVGFDGIKNNGQYYNKDSPPDRFRELNIELKPWKNDIDGTHILILGQNTIGTSVQNYDIIPWTQRLVEKIQRVSDRPIIYKCHPSQTTIPKLPDNCRIAPAKEQLNKYLKDAHHTICYSTNGSVESLIAGIPVITCAKINIAFSITDHTFDKYAYIIPIENPFKISEYGKQRFFNDLAYSQWSIEEMAIGLPWKHLLPHVNDR